MVAAHTRAHVEPAHSPGLRIDEELPATDAPDPAALPAALFEASRRHLAAALCSLAHRDVIRRRLWDAADSLVALLALSTARAGERAIEVPLGSEWVLLPTCGRNAHANPLTWLEAFYLAVASGRTEALELLDSVDAEHTLRGGGDFYPESLYLHVAALQATINEDADAYRRIRAATEATEAVDLPEDWRAFILEVQAPELAMLAAILDGDDARLERAIRGALDHRDRWFGGAGFFSRVALGPLALARLAEAYGSAVDIASPLLPGTLMS